MHILGVLLLVCTLGALVWYILREHTVYETKKVLPAKNYLKYGDHAPSYVMARKGAGV